MFSALFLFSELTINTGGDGPLQMKEGREGKKAKAFSILGSQAAGHALLEAGALPLRNTPNTGPCSYL